MARQRSSGSTTQAVKVGTTRTGTFGRRVAGVAGREVTGGRTGLTDSAISAGSKAHGRSAPSTGVGGAGGSSTTGVVAETNYPGGISAGYYAPEEVIPAADPGELFLPSPSVTPIVRTASPITQPRSKAPAPTAPRSYTPPKVTTPTAPKSAPVQGPFVTPIGGQYAPPPKPSTSKPFVTPIGGQYAPPPKPKSTTPVAKADTRKAPATTTPVKVSPKPAAPKPAPVKVATSTRRVAQ